VGTVGSGTERPVAASLKALTEPLLSSTHQGFLRSDATLAVIVVSDAIDQSPNSISYYLSRLQDVKGLDRPHLFTFSVVGPFDSTPPADCFYDSRSDDGRYQTLIDATKGIEAEICSSNWSSKLSDLGARAFGFPTRFGLSASPDLTQAFDVRVNGIPVIGWTYDAVSNSLNFTPALTPKANQTLTVGYTTLCL
jgi:hypothetical protein